MNVSSARRHPVPERAASIADQARDRPGDHERDGEGQKAQHQRQFARRDHVAVPPRAHAATLEAEPQPATTPNTGPFGPKAGPEAPVRIQNHST